MSNHSATRQYDWSDVSPSVAVVETIADLTDSELEALPPLAHAVNVSALDELLRETVSGNPDGVVVSLRYHGCDVTLSSSGWLEAER